MTLIPIRVSLCRCAARPLISTSTHASRNLCSIFNTDSHNPSSPHSRQVLNQLRASLSSPYPPSSSSAPLEFELEVVETKPTTEQLRTIRGYLNLPTTGEKSELQLEEPIVVNWNDGVASAGSAAPGAVLEALRQQRDERGGEGKKDEGGGKGLFGWFKS